MPRLPTPAPRLLHGRAFTVAEAQRQGLTQKTLRRPTLRAPHHGIRSLIEPGRAPSTQALMQQAAREYLPLLRQQLGEVFSHTSALLLFGAPIHVAPLLHVTIPRPHSAARGRNVIGHRTIRNSATVTIRLGSDSVPCAAPVEALLQAASQINFRELVVAVDHLIRLRGPHLQRSPLASLENLATAAARAATPGVHRLRAALHVARVGADSRMESLQHFELARMGIDDLEMQADIYAARGQWIGRFDAVDRARKRILEYDGEQHRTDRRQYLHDELRLDQAREAGHRIMRTHFEDFHPQEVARTRSRMCAFLEREPAHVPRTLARLFAECGP